MLAFPNDDKKDLIDKQKMAKHRKENEKQNEIKLWWKSNAMSMAVVIFIKHLDRQGRDMSWLHKANHFCETMQSYIVV